VIYAFGGDTIKSFVMQPGKDCKPPPGINIGFRFPAIIHLRSQREIDVVLDVNPFACVASATHAASYINKIKGDNNVLN